MSSDAFERPRAANGRAPDVFAEGGWIPMNQYRDADEVDFAIVGTGAGGGTLAARLAEKGFSVVAFDAGPFWRPLEDFASDETEQDKLYWDDRASSRATDPIVMGGKNSGKGVGGSMVHFAMVSLRFRPEWFKSRTTARLRRRLAARLARDVALLRPGRDATCRSRGLSTTPGARPGRAIPIARIPSTPPARCWRAAARPWA